MEQQLENQVIHKYERMLLLHHMIIKKKTGPADNIAKELNISTTQVYYLIQQLMELNPTLRYHHKFETYFYADGFPDHIAVSLVVVKGQDALKKLIEVACREPLTYNFLFT